MDNTYLCDHKLDYLKIALKISKMRYHGDEPTKELLEQAHEIGRLAGISEQELKILWNSTGAITMPGIYFIITIFGLIAFYLLLSMMRKQKQDEQKND